jgi:hypothetical protein
MFQTPALFLPSGKEAPNLTDPSDHDIPLQTVNLLREQIKSKGGNRKMGVQELKINNETQK